MWLSRPVYESLPYGYMLVGALLLGASFWVNVAPWSSVLLIAGIGALVVGLVLALRRTGYRKEQQEYSARSLDD